MSSSDVAIVAEGLGKRYRIGERERYRALRDVMARALLAPWQTLRRRLRATEQTLWALREVSFQVSRGEVFGIIGRNGAGKSTLLKILSRITEPTEGWAELRGRVGSLLEIGTGFHPELTGRENIYLSGAILGMRRSEIRREFDSIVSFAEVEKFIDTPVKRYSSGMYVRLAFAVAAHLKPEILLIDEVLAVGDVEFQRKCIGRMGTTAQEGRTVLLVSHSMSTVKALCDRAMLLDHGRVLAVGPVDEVVARYLGSCAVDPVEKVIYPEDHLYGGEKARVERIRLVRPAASSFSVLWGQPVEVEVEIEVLQHLQEVSFGAGIKNADGTWIFCAHHDDDGRSARWEFTPGRYRLRLTLQNPLKPGVYILCVGAHQEHASRNLFHVEAVTLEVLDHGEDGEVPHPYNPGIISVPAVFSAPQAMDPEPLLQKAEGPARP